MFLQLCRQSNLSTPISQWGNHSRTAYLRLAQRSLKRHFAHLGHHFCWLYRPLLLRSFLPWIVSSIRRLLITLSTFLSLEARHFLLYIPFISKIDSCLPLSLLLMFCHFYLSSLSSSVMILWILAVVTVYNRSSDDHDTVNDDRLVAPMDDVSAECWPRLRGAHSVW